MRDAGVIVLQVRLHHVQRPLGPGRAGQPDLGVDEQHGGVDVGPLVVVAVAGAGVRRAQGRQLEGTEGGDVFAVPGLLVVRLPHVVAPAGVQHQHLAGLAQHPPLVVNDDLGRVQVDQLPHPRQAVGDPAGVARQMVQHVHPPPADHLQQAGGRQVLVQVQPPAVARPQRPGVQAVGRPVPSVQVGHEDRQRVGQLLPQRFGPGEPLRFPPQPRRLVDVGGERFEHGEQVSVIDGRANLLPALGPQLLPQVGHRLPGQQRVDHLMVAVGRRGRQRGRQQRRAGTAGLPGQPVVGRPAPRPFLQQRAEQVNEFRPQPAGRQLVLQPPEPQVQHLGRKGAGSHLVQQRLQVHHVRVQRLARERQLAQPVVQHPQAIRRLAGGGDGLAELFVCVARASWRWRPSSRSFIRVTNCVVESCGSDKERPSGCEGEGRPGGRPGSGYGQKLARQRDAVKAAAAKAAHPLPPRGPVPARNESEPAGYKVG